ncbi:MAG TPA: hypothetical protein VMC62_09325 [Longilinea sp.]|nr:hypothetical protein [Longilinea sp.]
MRIWNLSPEDPHHLILAADARLSEPSFTNDHIWELQLGGGLVNALDVSTSYGGRAVEMHLFPRFQQNGAVLTDPRHFHQPPALNVFYPNYCRLTSQPFAGIETCHEYWVPSSQVIAGRLQFSNLTSSVHSFAFELAGWLKPLGEGQVMAPTTLGINTVLAGRTQSLWPVCIITGGPHPNEATYAGLLLYVTLRPGESHTFTWACVSLYDRTESFEVARQVCEAAWDASINRVERLNESQELEIDTGNPDWDTALAFSQCAAFGLFYPSNVQLPFPSAVPNRLPEQGYSTHDGKDYIAWGGITGLEALYLSNLVLPGAPELAEGLLRNFLASQGSDGLVNGLASLTGQRSAWQVQPVLAELCWRIAQCRQDTAWLNDIFPALGNYLNAWLSPVLDKEGDGIAKFQDLSQVGIDFDFSPADRISSPSGLFISQVESPALAVLLYNECQAMIRLSRLTRHEEYLPWLTASSARLQAQVAETWDQAAATYRYRDASTHQCDDNPCLLRLKSSGSFVPERNFKYPGRVFVYLKIHHAGRRRISIVIRGNGRRGKMTETLKADQFEWRLGEAWCAGNRVFDSVSEVKVTGLEAGDEGWLGGLKLRQEDISLLLPLWAGLTPQPQAKRLVEHNLSKRYLGRYGLSVRPSSGRAARNAADGQVNLLMNLLVGEGLVQYGYREMAADLVGRILDAQAAILKKEKGFRHSFDANSGEPAGERNFLLGLAPIALFLKTLGIECTRNDEVLVQGINPFSRPVTVKYRGTTIQRMIDETVVTFANGQSVTVSGPGPHRVSLSKD